MICIFKYPKIMKILYFSIKKMSYKICRKKLKGFVNTVHLSWECLFRKQKHVIYVWLDALTNYLSALNFPTEDEKYKDACT